MTFEAPRDMGGIEETEEGLFITDPGVLATLEAREKALEAELISLQAKVNNILQTLTSEENMDERLLGVFTKMLEDTLTKIKNLSEAPTTLH